MTHPNYAGPALKPSDEARRLLDAYDSTRWTERGEGQAKSDLLAYIAALEATPQNAGESCDYCAGRGALGAPKGSGIVMCKHCNGTGTRPTPQNAGLRLSATETETDVAKRYSAKSRLLPQVDLSKFPMPTPMTPQGAGEAVETVIQALLRCPNDGGFDREIGPIGCKLVGLGLECVCSGVVPQLRELSRRADKRGQGEPVAVEVTKAVQAEREAIASWHNEQSKRYGLHSDPASLRLSQWHNTCAVHIRARAALYTPKDASTQPVGEEQKYGFLNAYVSEDAQEVGIWHESGTDWQKIRAAHIALRDRINERLEQEDLCPHKPAALAHPAATQETKQTARRPEHDERGWQPK